MKTADLRNNIDSLNEALAKLVKIGASRAASTGVDAIPIPAPVEGDPQISRAGYTGLYGQILLAYVHEAGHAAALRHLLPGSEPHVTVEVSVSMAPEGVGASLDDATCTSSVAVEDDESNFIVSAAGWMSEILVLAEDDRVHCGPNALLGALWLHPKFIEHFPGMVDDHMHAAAAAASLFGLTPEGDEPPVEARSGMVTKLCDMLATTARIILPHRADILAAAHVEAARRVSSIISASQVIAREMQKLHDENASPVSGTNNPTWRNL